MSRQTITLSKDECREALRALEPAEGIDALEARGALIEAFIQSRTETIKVELSSAARQALAAALATRESWLRDECEAGLAAGEPTVATTYEKLLRWAASARARIEEQPLDGRPSSSADRQAGPAVPRGGVMRGHGFLAATPSGPGAISHTPTERSDPCGPSSGPSTRLACSSYPSSSTGGLCGRASSSP